MHLARPRRALTQITALFAAAALVVACAADDDTTAAPPEDETAPDADPEAGDLDDLLGGDEELDLPDPNDEVEDGVFRGVGVLMPTPEGWELDPMSYAQGMVVALAADGRQTLAAQAVDTDDLPDEDLDFDQLLEANRQDLGGAPDADEEVDLQGAERAHLLRFDDLPAQEEGAPVNSLLTVIADDGAGQLAMFNYLAPTEDYDEDLQALLLAEGGFDPDSDPSPPLPG